jgi:hypothetical protein
VREAGVSPFFPQQKAFSFRRKRLGGSDSGSPLAVWPGMGQKRVAFQVPMFCAAAAAGHCQWQLRSQLSLRAEQKRPGFRQASEVQVVKDWAWWLPPSLTAGLIHEARESNQLAGRGRCLQLAPPPASVRGREVAGPARLPLLNRKTMLGSRFPLMPAWGPSRGGEHRGSAVTSLRWRLLPLSIFQVRFH